MSKKIIAVIIIFTVLINAAYLPIGSVTLNYLFGEKISHDFEVYEKARFLPYRYNERMPEIEEFEPCSDIKFTYFCDYHLVFESESYTVVADYSKSDYEEKKSYFMNRDEVTKSFTHGDFDMIRLKKGEDEPEFPKSAYYYGFNDDTNQIVFVRYYDQNLDVGSDLSVLNDSRFDDTVK